MTMLLVDPDSLEEGCCTHCGKLLFLRRYKIVGSFYPGPEDIWVEYCCERCALSLKKEYDRSIIEVVESSC